MHLPNYNYYSDTPDIRTCVFGPRASRVEVAGVNGVFESLGLTSRRLKLKKIFPNETLVMYLPIGPKTQVLMYIRGRAVGLL